MRVLLLRTVEVIAVAIGVWLAASASAKMAPGDVVVSMIAPGGGVDLH